MFLTTKNILSHRRFFCFNLLLNFFCVKSLVAFVKAILYTGNKHLQRLWAVIGDGWMLVTLQILYYQVSVVITSLFFIHTHISLFFSVKTTLQQIFHKIFSITIPGFLFRAFFWSLGRKTKCSCYTTMNSRL